MARFLRRQPPKPHYGAPPALGAAVASFSVEMSAGCQPPRPCLVRGARIPLPLAPTAQNDSAPFGPEMSAGWHPESPRIFIYPKIGLQLSETSPVASPFGPEMVGGWHPDRAVLGKPQPIDRSTNLTVFDFVSLAMVQGYHTDGPRLPFMSKGGWQTSQTTHVPAPFSPEMAQGWQPARAILGKPAPINWSVVMLTFDIFSNEMVYGWVPLRPVLGKPFPQGWSMSQTTPVAVPFSVEMTAGCAPPTQRVLMGARAMAPLLITARPRQRVHVT